MEQKFLAKFPENPENAEFFPNRWTIQPKFWKFSRRKVKKIGNS